MMIAHEPTKFKIGDVVVMKPEMKYINKKYTNERRVVIDMVAYYIAPIIVFGPDEDDWSYEGNLMLLSELRKKKINKII